MNRGRKRGLVAPVWSPEELKLLRDNYPTEGADGCCPLIPNRSRSSIVMRASMLGLRLTPEALSKRRRVPLGKRLGTGKGLASKQLATARPLEPLVTERPIAGVAVQVRSAELVHPTQLEVGMVINRYPAGCRGLSRSKLVRVVSIEEHVGTRIHWLSLCWEELDGRCRGFAGWDLRLHPELKFEHMTWMR